MAQARAPKGMVEWLNVKDIADAAWEGERLKRLKTRFCQRAADSPQLWAFKIPHFGGAGDQPVA